MLAIKLILRATLICKLGTTFYFGLRTGVQGEKVRGSPLPSVAFGHVGARTRSCGAAPRPELDTGKGASKSVLQLSPDALVFKACGAQGRSWPCLFASLSLEPSVSLLLYRCFLRAFAASWWPCLCCICFCVGTGLVQPGVFIIIVRREGRGWGALSLSLSVSLSLFLSYSLTRLLSTCRWPDFVLSHYVYYLVKTSRASWVWRPFHSRDRK